MNKPHPARRHLQLPAARPRQPVAAPPRLVQVGPASRHAPAPDRHARGREVLHDLGVHAGRGSFRAAPPRHPHVVQARAASSRAPRTAPARARPSRPGPPSRPARRSKHARVAARVSVSRRSSLRSPGSRSPPSPEGRNSRSGCASAPSSACAASISCRARFPRAPSGRGWVSVWLPIQWPSACARSASAPVLAQLLPDDEERGEQPALGEESRTRVWPPGPARCRTSVRRLRITASSSTA